ETRLSFRVVRGEIHEHADAAYTPALLRPRRERPRRRAAEQRDERAAVGHSITSSATLRSVGGDSIPRAWAVMRLTTRSDLVGCPPGYRRVSRRAESCRHNRPRAGKGPRFWVRKTSALPLWRHPESQASSAAARPARAC